LFGIAQTETQIKSRKIKVVVSHTTELKDGITVRKFERESFDKKGNLIERESFSTDSLRVLWKKFEYDRKGNVLKEYTLQPSNGAVKSKKEFSYNKFNDEVLVITRNSSEAIEEEIETQYDKDRRKSVVIKRDGQKKTIATTTFEYDNRGMLISRKTVNSNGEVIVEKTISYTY
jgi:hypothetical protein